jgi:hypothetical protein
MDGGGRAMHGAVAEATQKARKELNLEKHEDASSNHIPALRVDEGM